MAMRGDDNPYAAPESDLEPESYSRTPSRKLDYAGFFSRFVAMIVDWIIVYTVVLMILLGAERWWKIPWGPPSSVVQPGNLADLGGAIIGWLYFALQESSVAQATLGKKMMGIKVIDLDGQRISFGRATGRHFAKIVSGIICGIGYLMQPFTEKRQALHDSLASCLVVKI